MSRAAVVMAILALFAFAAVVDAAGCHESCYTGSVDKNKIIKTKLFKDCKATIASSKWSAGTCGCGTHVAYCFATEAARDKYQDCEHGLSTYKNTLAKTKASMKSTVKPSASSCKKDYVA